MVDPYVEQYGNPTRAGGNYIFYTYYWDELYVIFQEDNYQWHVLIEHVIDTPISILLEPYFDNYQEPGKYEEIFRYSYYKIEIYWYSQNLRLDCHLNLLSGEDWTIEEFSIY